MASSWKISPPNYVDAVKWIASYIQCAVIHGKLAVQCLWIRVDTEIERYSVSHSTTTCIELMYVGKPVCVSLCVGKSAVSKLISLCPKDVEAQYCWREGNLDIRRTLAINGLVCERGHVYNSCIPTLESRRSLPSILSSASNFDIHIMPGFLPEPLRMLVTNPAIWDFSSDGPLPYALRQKFTGRLPPVTSDISFASRTVLVTGATSGVGLEAARQLAQLGPRLLILGARNLSKANRIKREIEEKIPHLTVRTAELDLESLSSVDRFVDELSANTIRLDLALLNAGFFGHDDRITEDGYSPLFQVNFLSTAYLALRLLPLLRETAIQQGAAALHAPRLVLVTSEGHAWTTFPDLPEQTENNTLPILSVFREKKTLGSADDQYYRAKLLLALFGKELSRRLSAADINTTVVITTPGFCASNFFPDGVMTRLIQLTSARSIQQGGALHVFAATAQGPEIHGAYLRDGKPTR